MAGDFKAINGLIECLNLSIQSEGATESDGQGRPTEPVLDCGGKRSATPLSDGRAFTTRTEPCRRPESGVALRFPPQSMTPSCARSGFRAKLPATSNHNPKTDARLPVSLIAGTTSRLLRHMSRLEPQTSSARTAVEISTPPGREPALRTPLRLLPHEWSFGGFLAITWIRLAVQLGPLNLYSLIFLGCLLGAVAAYVWARRDPSALRWRVRLLYFPSVMGVTFYTLGAAIPALTPKKFDTMLLEWDQALLGETPAVSYQAWSQPWLNDLLMLGYLFFFIHLVVVPGIYCVRDLARFRQCIVGLFTLYGIGFLFYTLVPAGGPHRWMTFDVPLAGIIVIPATLDTVNAGSNGVDVFPSLHLAVSFYLLVFDWWHARSRFWIVLGPCILLWLSTVLLRFHYFVDLIGGLLLAIIGLMAAVNFQKRWGARDLPSR
jgi:membrane-associated phospholipid phosphatase